MVTLQEAKAMRDALRAAMVATKAALGEADLRQQFYMLLPIEERMRDWHSGRLSIHIDKADDAVRSILRILDSADEQEEAAKEVQQ